MKLPKKKKIDLVLPAIKPRTPSITGNKPIGDITIIDEKEERRNLLSVLVNRREKMVKAIDDTQAVMDDETVNKKIDDELNYVRNWVTAAPEPITGYVSARVLGVREKDGRRLPLPEMAVRLMRDDEVLDEVLTDLAGNVVFTLPRGGVIVRPKKPESKPEPKALRGKGADVSRKAPEGKEDESDSGKLVVQTDDKKEKPPAREVKGLTVEVLAPDGHTVAREVIKPISSKSPIIVIKVAERKELLPAFTKGKAWLKAEEAAIKKAKEIKEVMTKAIINQRHALKKSLESLNVRIDKLTGDMARKGGKGNG